MWIHKDISRDLEYLPKWQLNHYWTDVTYLRDEAKFCIFSLKLEIALKIELSFYAEPHKFHPDTIFCEFIH